LANVVRGRKMQNVDEIRHLKGYRFIFQQLCAGVHMTVVTETLQEPEIVFGTYAKVFNIYMRRGQLDLITIAEAPDDLENYFFL